MLRPGTLLSTFVALISAGCHASSMKANTESLGMMTIGLIGGALLIAFLVFAYGSYGKKKD